MASAINGEYSCTLACEAVLKKDLNRIESGVATGFGKKAKSRLPIRKRTFTLQSVNGSSPSMPLFFLFWRQIF